MKKIIRIIVLILALLPLALGIQSFSRMIPLPVPDETVVKINDIPTGEEVRIQMCGYLYTAPLNWHCDITDVENTEDPEYFNTGEKFKYPTSTAASIYVWTWDDSESDWDFNGSIYTNDSDITISSGGGYIYLAEFDWGDLNVPSI
jgi:hypothetical protein